MVRFTILLLIVVVVVGFGVYYTAPFWLDGIRKGPNAISEEAFKAIVAALATAIAALIAAGASILNVGLQLRAGKSLEETKKRLSEQLMQESEDYKTRVSTEAAETARRLARLDEIRELASGYRFALGLLRGGRHEEEEIEGFQDKIARVKDSLDPEEPLYRPWAIFYQRGHNLNQVAKAAKSPRARRDIWTIQNDQRRALGVDFAESAEEVLRIVRQKRVDLLEAASRPKTK
jgi:hypothetical protein